jgi:hypothetical protein
MAQAPSTAPSTGGGLGGVLGTISKALPAITKGIGAVRDIYDVAVSIPGGAGFLNSEFVREATKQLKDEQNRVYGQIQDVFGEIAGLTGVSTDDAVQQYYKQFSDYMDKAYTQGRADLASDPNITKQYEQLGNRVKDIQTQYSLLSNPRFAQAYKAPDAVTPIDVDAIKGTMTLGPAFAEQYSYRSPQSQEFIYGPPDAVREIASFYSNNPNISNLMNYG